MDILIRFTTTFMAITLNYQKNQKMSVKIRLVWAGICIIDFKVKNIIIVVCCNTCTTMFNVKCSVISLIYDQLEFHNILKELNRLIVRYDRIFWF